MGLMSPSEKQVKLWKLLNEVYYNKFSDNESWDEYLYDLGISCYLNEKQKELDIPNPSGQGNLRITTDIAEQILKLGMPWRVK